MQHDHEADKIAADARKKCHVPSRKTSAIISILMLIAAYPITRLFGIDDFVGYLAITAMLLILYLFAYLLLGRCAQREAERRLIQRGLDRLNRVP